MSQTKTTTIILMLGTGLYELFKAELGKEEEVSTEYGNAVVSRIGNFEANLKVFAMMRHGKEHTIPPHLINYRANLASAKKIGADFIVATASVGAINPSIRVGTYVVPDQFIDFTRTRISTFYSQQGVFSHIDMTNPYSGEIRKALIKSIRKDEFKLRDSGTYACTEGPRFETPAEIRMYRRLGGDIVGMTGVPEVVLANELSIPYGCLAHVTNMAAGLQSKVSQEEVNREMAKSLAQTRSILLYTIKELARV